MQFIIEQERNADGQLAPAHRVVGDPMSPRCEPCIQFQLLDDDEHIVAIGKVTNVLIQDDDDYDYYDDFARLAGWGMRQYGATILRFNMSGEAWETLRSFRLY
jgi:hypothetical protein